MAKVVVTLAQDWRKIAELAGGDSNLIMFDPPTSELEVADVTQAALNTAFANYSTNQAAIDAATAAALLAARKAIEKSSFDQGRLLKAFAELLVDELNILRALHGLAPRTFAQLRNAIRNKIDAAP